MTTTPPTPTPAPPEVTPYVMPVSVSWDRRDPTAPPLEYDTYVTEEGK